jgi:surface polysaccharide O-acyltransferase-like enzyme
MRLMKKWETRPGARGVTRQPREIADVNHEPGRDHIDSLDIFRGLAILAVLGIHVSGHSLHMAEVDSRAWIVLAFSNRALQFAVPAFLLLSALLNLRPLLERPPGAAWVYRRLRRAVWPYLIWSLIFLAISYRHDPGALTPALVVAKIAGGNAYYHLYFLLLVIQLYVLLPFLAPLFRRRPPFWAVATGALGLQAAIYAANRRWPIVTAPGSVIFWYVPSIAVGCWLSTRWSRLAELARKAFLPALLVAAAAFAIHAPLAMDLLRHEALNTFVFQASLSLYAAAASLALMGVSGSGAAAWAAAPLRYIGARSLEIYILHPLAILALDEWLPFSIPRSPAVSTAVYFIACIALPLAVAAVVARLGLSGLLWGLPAKTRAARAESRLARDGRVGRGSAAD